jgi:hypothetical protein
MEGLFGSKKKWMNNIGQGNFPEVQRREQNKNREFFYLT